MPKRRRPNLQDWEEKQICEMAIEWGCPATARLLGMHYQSIFGVLKRSGLWEPGKYGRGNLIPPKPPESGEDGSLPCRTGENGVEGSSGDLGGIWGSWTEPDIFERGERLHPAILDFFERFKKRIECGD